MSRCMAGAVALGLMFALAVPAAATPPGTNGAIGWQRESSTGPPHLWVAGPDGSGARKVFATADRAEFEATFSPTDPNLMFFTRGAAAPYSEDLFSGNLQSGAVTRVTTARSADIAPTVSPDGTRLVYFAAPRPKKIRPDVPGPNQRIHVAGLDGSNDVAVTSAARNSFDPDWSPDGTRIVYAEVRFVGKGKTLRGQNRIAVINADGTGRHVLSRYGGADEVNPKWMSDGRAIVFESLKQTGTRSDLMAMNPDGTGVRPLLATAAWETNPIPSPDGTRILFTSDRDRRGRDRLGPGFELYTMALDGSDIVRLTNNRSPDVFPDWQRLPPA